MCTQYVAYPEALIYQEAKSFTNEAPGWAPDRVTVRPTNPGPVVAVKEGRRRLVTMQWGLRMDVPGARGPVPRTVVNAKAENINRVEAWRTAAAGHRCLLLVTGFLESRTLGDGSKWPYLFRLRDRAAYPIAGIWFPAAGDLPDRMVMMTTRPNEFVAKLHDRMPVVLTIERAHRWLGDAPLAKDELKSLLEPIEATGMTMHPVDRRVNSAKERATEALLQPVEIPEQSSLF